MINNTDMKPMTLKQAADACSGTLTGPDGCEDIVIKNITIDSRKVSDGFLYIPIKGERFDGHDFISSAFDKGCICTLTEHPDKSSDKPQIAVTSTSAALRDIAGFYRSLFKTTIIGITGSSGKTSTKEMIYSVLSSQMCVMKTEGNLNNEIGVPQTLFRLRDEHQAAVIEMGINHFGEMTNLAKMVRPDIAVITNIGCAHLEFLGSRDGILKAKTEMLDFLSPQGCAVLNGDDDKLITVNSVKTLFFGLKKSNACHAEEIKQCGFDGTEFTIVHDGRRTPAFVPALGNHMIMNALAGFTIAKLLNIDDEKAAQGIRNFKNIDGRFNVIRLEDKTIINDCYNANPESVKASLNVMSTLGGRKAAVLADMKELGDDSDQMHIMTGRLAAKSVDVLICIGTQAKLMEKGASEENRDCRVFFFENNAQAINELPDILKKDDVILVKGSHSMKLEEITAALKNISLK